MSFSNNLTFATTVSPSPQAVPPFLPDYHINSFVSELRTRGLANTLVDPALACALTTGSIVSTSRLSQTSLGVAETSGDFPCTNESPVSVSHPPIAIPCHKMSFKKNKCHNKSLQYLAFDPPHQSHRRSNTTNAGNTARSAPLPTTSPITVSTPARAIQTVQPQLTRGATSPQTQSRSSSRSSSRQIKFKCPLCPSTFSRKDNLKTHQRLHSGEMPFQCQYCGRKFRWQSSARTHEQVHERHGHSPMRNSESVTSTQPQRPQQDYPALGASGNDAGPSYARPNPLSSSGQDLAVHMSSVLTSVRQPVAVGSRMSLRGETDSLGPSIGAQLQPYASSLNALQSVPPNHLSVEDSQCRVSLDYQKPVEARRIVPTNYDAPGTQQSSTAAITGPGSAVEASCSLRRSREWPRRESERSIRRARPPPAIFLNLDDIFEGHDGEMEHVGQDAPGTTVTTPQLMGESPMFSLPKLSQQDLERCLDEKPDN